MRNFSLSWRFNNRQTILTKTAAGVKTVTDAWNQFVEVSESGSLTLQDLSPHQEGTYTCELRDADQTMITVSVLKINQGKT